MKNAENARLIVVSRVIFLVALCVFGASAQIYIPGVCQDVSIQQDFDIPAYLGLWYEQQRYFASFELDGKCVTATYSDNMNGTVGVNNFMINSKTGEEFTILGYATPVGENGEGKLEVTFPTVGSASNYWVLGTDYVNYSVVWSCYQVSADNTLQTSWLLTRQRVPSAETLARAQTVIDANSLAPEYLITDQSTCE